MRRLARRRKAKMLVPSYLAVLNDEIRRGENESSRPGMRAWKEVLTGKWFILERRRALPVPEWSKSGRLGSSPGLPARLTSLQTRLNNLGHDPTGSRASHQELFGCDGLRLSVLLLRGGQGAPRPQCGHDVRLYGLARPAEGFSLAHLCAPRRYPKMEPENGPGDDRDRRVCGGQDEVVADLRRGGGSGQRAVRARRG